MPDALLSRMFAAPARIERAEMIDSGDATPEDFEGTFRDMARINRHLGGMTATLRALRRLVAALPPCDRPVRILDIATGGADVPRAIAREARAGRLGGRGVEVAATDGHPAVLELARRWTPASEYPEVMIAEADALRLPYEDGAFDLALCSLALHHFSTDDASRIVSEMERVTTGGWIVNDLLRSRVAYGLIWALARAVRAHPLTCHDGPVSVMRAYTPSEYTELARRAGILDCEVRAVPMYRVLMYRQKTGAGAERG